MAKMKQFSKFDNVKFMQQIGLLSSKLNRETGEFETCWPLRIRSYLSLFCLRLTFPLRLSVSYLYPRDSEIQFYLGNLYNCLPDRGRYFIAYVGVIVFCWIAFHFVVFNHLNARNGHRLYRVWLRLTQEVQTNYKVAGLSQEENKNFWVSENRITQIGYRMITGVAILFLASVSTLFFYTKADVDWLTYLFFQTFHIAHHAFMVSGFLYSLFMVTLFYITIMRFFAKRFRSISNHLGRMKMMTKPTVNRKMSKLILDYNQVEHELLEMNDFFKVFTSCNLICFFAFGILVSFLGIDRSTDWRLRLGLSAVMPGMYLVVLAPFIFANRVSIELKKTKRLFENIAFKRSIHLATKQKIENISNLSDTIDFTCADWFTLSSRSALAISLEFGCCLLLLIQTYYVKNSG